MKLPIIALSALLIAVPAAPVAADTVTNSASRTLLYQGEGSNFELARDRHRGHRHRGHNHHRSHRGHRHHHHQHYYSSGYGYRSYPRYYNRGYYRPYYYNSYPRYYSPRSSFGFRLFF